jgi:DNA processing protein
VDLRILSYGEIKMRLEEEKPVSEEELAHWLAFSMLNGVGPKRLLALEEQLSSIITAWNASSSVLQRIKGFGEETIAAVEKGRREINPHKLLEEFKETGMKAWTWKDPQYPIQLKHIADPPIVLFVNGNLSPEMLTHTIGVVGTRRPSNYGQKIARDVAQGLSENGVTIVSGMAVGIDSIAHRGAIEGGSPTVAVLGCGADVCYPTSNNGLFNELIEDGKGAVISEYFPGTLPEKFRFPARNRIISGISQALVVVEGGLDSGSLITAYQAFDQSREVFAFPGRIDNPMSEGPHKLIRNNNAHLCTSYKDILNELNWVQTNANPERERPSVVQLYGRERELYELITSEPVHFDTLSNQTGMDTGELSATLTMLELAGLISRDPGDWYSRHGDVKVSN